MLDASHEKREPPVRTSRARILVAELDATTRESIAASLGREGFQTIQESQGVAALSQTCGRVDLSLIDADLQGLDGLNVLREVRRRGSQIPIIVMSHRAEEIDRVLTFELGADDFIPKPLMPREVVCRVRAVLRRTHEKEHEPALLRFGALEIDEAAREARANGVDLGLRPKEFALLLLLAQHRGMALSRKMLIERAWGFDYEGDDRTIDGHVRRIRQRLEQFGLSSLIATIYGFGYKFIATMEAGSFLP